MHSNRFTDLLNRYIADQATAEERDELMAMISEGTHDEQIFGKIRTMLESKRMDQGMDDDAAREVLKGILSVGRKPGKVVPLFQRAYFKWYSAAAVIFAMIAAGWWLQDLQPAHETVATSIAAQATPTVFVGEQVVHLPDGSTVILNKNSRLSYTAVFGDTLREVKLTGEAFFNVARDVTRPFTVVTGNITTRVLGTSFNVSAYPNEQQVKVTVTHGKVQVNSEERLLGIITPDQQISVNTVTYDFVQRSVKAEQATAWQNQYLILDNVSLEEAAKTIAEKYDVTVSLSNEALKTCRISATFLRGESLKQVLTVVSGVVQATYSINENGSVIIDGKGCL